MITELEQPTSVGFFADRITRQREALRIVDSGAMPIQYYEGIPLHGETAFHGEKGLIFGMKQAIFSDYLQLRDMGKKKLADNLVRK